MIENAQGGRSIEEKSSSEAGVEGTVSTVSEPETRSPGRRRLRFRTVLISTVFLILAGVGVGLFLRYLRISEFRRAVRASGGTVVIEGPAWAKKLKSRYDPFEEVSKKRPAFFDAMFGDVVSIDAGFRGGGGDWVADLPLYTRLKNLRLHCSVERAEHSLSVQGLPELETLDLTIENDRVGAADRVLALLEGTPKLKSLVLRKNRLTGRGLENLANCPVLESLGLMESALDDSAFAAIGRAERLKTLNLLGVSVTETRLASLKPLAYLDVLNLQRTRIIDADLKGLDGLPALSLLDLRDAWINGSGFEDLRSLPNLQMIVLDGTLVTDRALKSLSRFPNLLRVHVAGTRITDAGLANLGTLPHLLEVIVRETQTTPAGISDFTSKHPTVRVKTAY